MTFVAPVTLTEFVSAGGTASGTTINGGSIDYVLPGGTANGATLSGGTQVVYGTDIPLVWPDSIDNILAAKIPDDQKEMVLGGNLTKLLKLPS